MDMSNHADTLNRAYSNAEAIGEIIAAHIPHSARIELFAALIEHLTTTIDNEPERIVRVFETGIISGVNKQIRTDTESPPAQ